MTTNQLLTLGGMPTLASISDRVAPGGNSTASAGTAAVGPADEAPGRCTGVGDGGGMVMILVSWV